MDTMSVEEARQRLGVGRSLIYRMVNAGQLPSIRLGRTIRIPITAYEQFLSNTGGKQ